MSVQKAQLFSSDNKPCAVPPVDLLETCEHFLLLLDLPGVPTERVNIAVHDGTFTVRGAPERTRSAGQRWLHTEIQQGVFQRTFQFCDHLVDMDKASAHLENGVLSLILPKRRPKRWRRIPVREVP